MKVEFEIEDPVAQKIVGLMKNGMPAEIVLSVQGGKVIGVSANVCWLKPGQVPVRSYIPDQPAPKVTVNGHITTVPKVSEATGVYIAANRL